MTLEDELNAAIRYLFRTIEDTEPSPIGARLLTLEATLEAIAFRMEGKVLVKPAHVVGGDGTISAVLPTFDMPCWGVTGREADARLQAALDEEVNR